uniref:Uncharacterized protein n=1 Tax=Bubo bubo TaxID=30461 RepID=A0A8C0FS17_BUBBB
MVSVRRHLALEHIIMSSSSALRGGGHKHKPPRATRGADKVVCPQGPVGCGTDPHQKPAESRLQAAIGTRWTYSRPCPRQGHPAGCNAHHILGRFVFLATWPRGPGVQVGASCSTIH